MNLPIPDQVTDLMERLEGAGFAAYVVGGGLRDSLLGKTPADWDIATAARPEQVRAALAGIPVRDTGLRHGTVTAVLGEMAAEITTFRTEGTYSDRRRPDQVRFSDTVQEDLSRRDFTVNAMAFSKKNGLIDPFGGLDDLKAGVLRAVGDPRTRFDEDPLRILRGLRFSARLGFSIEPATGRAMEEKRGLLSLLSPQRIGGEMIPLLCAPGAAAVLRRYRGIFGTILPELVPMFDFDQQNPHHIYDVWEHTLHALAAVPPDPVLRLTMLLHDCGKPARFTVDFRGDGHFYGHAAESARLARTALDRMAIPGETGRRVLALIGCHDYDLQAGEKSLLRWLARLGPEALFDLIWVKRADNLAQNPRYSRQEGLDAAEAALRALLSRRPCFDRKSLALTGGEVKELGLSGPAIGGALDRLVAAVMAGEVPNEKTALIHWLKQEKISPDGA